MKKRIFVFLSLITCFALASCGGSQPNTDWWSDEPTDEMIAELGLDQFGKNGNGKVINDATLDEAANEYAKVFLNTDVKSSLFVTINDLDPLFEEYEEKVNDLIVKGMTFREVREDDKIKVMQAIWDETNGFNSLQLELPFTSNCGSWNKTISLEEAYNGYVAGTKNNCIATVYLPVYLYHFKEAKKYTTVYMMVPVYTAITTRDGSTLAAPEFAGIRVANLKIAQDGYIDYQGATQPEQTAETTTESTSN